MKKLALVTMFFLSLSVGAVTVDQFCNQFFFQDKKIECFKKASGKEFQGQALDVCQKFFHDDDKILCLTKVADKIYSNGELQACTGAFSDQDKMQCLVDLGRPFPPQTPPTDQRRLDAIRKNAVFARDAVNIGDQQGAINALNNIINLSTR